MTLLFQGSERDSFVENTGVGGYTETTSGAAIEASTRAGVSVSASNAAYIEAVAQTTMTEGWLHAVGTYVGTSGSPNLTPLIGLMDASNNVLVRLYFTSANSYALQYWDGAAFATVGGAIAHNGTGRPDIEPD